MLRKLSFLIFRVFIFIFAMYGVLIFHKNIISIYVDTELSLHMKMFSDLYSYETDKQLDLSHINAVFGGTDKDVLAYCQKRYIFGYLYQSTIVVNPRIWGESSDLSRTAIMFHELGHCALSRIHVENYAKLDQCPRSLMVRTKMSDVCIKKHFDHYVLELFELKK